MSDIDRETEDVLDYFASLKTPAGRVRDERWRRCGERGMPDEPFDESLYPDDRRCMKCWRGEARCACGKPELLGDVLARSMRELQP